MSSNPKSHKAMGEGEWMVRLKKFASSGVWPAGGGNRPAPRQRKWHDLYQKIEKCPMQARGQTNLFGGSIACSCGFHTVKALGVTLSSAPPAPAPAPVRKLTRKVQHNTCKKCGQFRIAETGHSQYKGIVYCPSVEALPKEQWLENIKQNPK